MRKDFSTIDKWESIKYIDLNKNTKKLWSQQFLYEILLL